VSPSSNIDTGAPFVLHLRPSTDANWFASRMLPALGSGRPWRCGLPAPGLMTSTIRLCGHHGWERAEATEGRRRTAGKAASAGAWKLAEVIPKASFASVKFTYTFDLRDDWTHGCEVVASEDPPDFARAPGYVRASLPVPRLRLGNDPDQCGRLRDDDQP